MKHNGENWEILVGDVLDRLEELPAESVQTCVTSPPYWGLRDYHVDGQIGSEASVDEFVEVMVRVFSQVRRVLRDDGTLWLNLGDSYNAYNGGAGPGSSFQRKRSGERPNLPTGFGLRTKALKPKDLIGVPWRVALALQAYGWFLRSDIIWAKPNPMPESIRDRPTKAHEYVFLLAKSQRYFFDSAAVRESAPPQVVKVPDGWDTGEGAHGTIHRNGREKGKNGHVTEGRNVRSVWTIGTQAYPEAHFATFPEALPERCIKAGTPERGCCSECGAPWKRIVEKNRRATRPRTGSKVNGVDSSVCGNRDAQRHVTDTKTVGWEPSCECGANTVPSVVLDPFTGSGTTGKVALLLGRRFVGIELNPEYAELAVKRIQQRHGSRGPRQVESLDGQRSLF